MSNKPNTGRKTNLDLPFSRAKAAVTSDPVKQIPAAPEKAPAERILDILKDLPDEHKVEVLRNVNDAILVQLLKKVAEVFAARRLAETNIENFITTLSSAEKRSAEIEKSIQA